MIIAAMLIVVQSQPYHAHPRELPETAVEWLDHYGYCLEVNHQQLIQAIPNISNGEAVRRSAVSCWPVRSSASIKISEHLVRDDARTGANERLQIVNRVLNMAARDFALRVGASPNDLTELCAPYSDGDCDASD